MVCVVAGSGVVEFPPFMCRYCPESSWTEDLIRSHLASAHADKPPQFGVVQDCSAVAAGTLLADDDDDDDDDDAGIDAGMFTDQPQLSQSSAFFCHRIRPSGRLKTVVEYQQVYLWKRPYL